MRSGGAGSVLNSKGDFNCSYIPRLTVEELDKVKVRGAGARGYQGDLVG